jgi:dCMP deaminase
VGYLLAYVPAITRGYHDLLTAERYDEILLPSKGITECVSSLHKDIRALPTGLTARIIEGIVECPVRIVSLAEIAMRVTDDSIFDMPNDEVTEYITKSLNMPETRVRKINTFLRWHRLNIKENSEVRFDSQITIDDIPIHIIERMHAEQGSSNDWWRQVGSVLVNNDSVVIGAHNHYVPGMYSAEIDGDVRAQASKGVSMDILNAQHSEASLIAQAARAGIKVDGMDVYMTTFPCPSCAKLLAESGIKRVYFFDGYAVGDGFEVLKSMGIEIVHVTGWENNTHITTPIKYRES